LELLVVLAIISLLLSLFSTMTGYSSGTMNPRYQAILIAQDLRLAHALARTRGISLDVAFNVEKHQWTGPDGRSHDLPAGTGVEVTSVQVNAVTTSNIVRFFPDGTSTGGKIVLSRENHFARIGVDWLTGRVGVDQIGPTDGQ
jgi:general secretion pathway protein H